MIPIKNSKMPLSKEYIFFPRWIFLVHERCLFDSKLQPGFGYSQGSATNGDEEFELFFVIFSKIFFKTLKIISGTKKLSYFFHITSTIFAWGGLPDEGFRKLKEFPNINIYIFWSQSLYPSINRLNILFL